MGTAMASPRLTALRAQRLLGIFGFSIVPAMTAGTIASFSLASLGDGVIVFVAVLAASLILERERYPLHLMPFASLVVRATAPLLGIGLALMTFVLAGAPKEASEMIVPLVGAWIITVFATVIRVRFELSRQIRIGVIGSPALASGLAEELRLAGIGSHEVVGWVDGERPTAAAAIGGPRRLGSFDQIREVVTRHSIDFLVHSSGTPASDEAEPRRSRLEIFEQVAECCLDLPVRLIEASQLYEDLLGHVPLGQSNAAWFQYLLHPRYRAGASWSKRVFDLVVGGGMLLAMLLPLAIFAIAIKLTDGGPIFYRQRRIGEGGHEFEMIKLRSMRVAAEEVGARWSEDEDDRVTSVGRLMRRLHMDEMPQLWNVLRGEMTIVGPRPERRELIVDLERRLAYYDRRHLVKPGLAGWAQARCGYGGSEGGTGWKLCHDLYYLKHRSVYFDSLVLLENVRVSLSGGGVQFGARAPQEQFILGEIGHVP
jgi:lipopolysaccharide/colanic/teichoic acid biosynthesis glycosyltransferase